MENKAHAFWAGLFTLGLMMALALVVIWLNHDGSVKTSYELVTQSSVSGLNPQASVRYRGLDVGLVDSISFDQKATAEQTGQIVIHITINADTPITESTYAIIASQGVTGLGYIQLDDEGMSHTLLKGTPEQPARIPIKPSLFDKVQAKTDLILSDAQRLTSELATFFNTDRQQQMSDLVSSLDQAVHAYAEIPGQLKPALARLPQLETEFQKTASNLNTLTQELRQLTTQLNSPQGPLMTTSQKLNETLDQLKLQSGQIGTSLQHISQQADRDLLPQLNDLLIRAQTATTALERAGNLIERQPKSLLFGRQPELPGPGEPGFQSRRQPVCEGTSC